MSSEAACAIDLTNLPAEVVALIARLQQQEELARRSSELTLAQAKIDKLNFELARLRRWQFDAKTEVMTAAHGCCSPKLWPRTKPAFARSWPN